MRGWAPVLAILDSTKLLHLGSSVHDDQILAEGRKRFLLTMKCLRSSVGSDPRIALPGLMVVSTGVSLCEVSLVYYLPRNQKNRLAIPPMWWIRDRADFFKIYSAISDEDATVSWQKQVVGMSALLLGQRPVNQASRLETFMVARLRTAQVRQPFFLFACPVC